jgi:hypothetical protein
LINKQLKEQNYIDESELQGLTSKSPLNQRKLLDKQNKSLDMIISPNTHLNSRHEFTSKFQAKNVKNMAKFGE